MALLVDYHAVQSCDCCNFSIVDDTNYDDNPTSLFSARTIILTYASGKQSVIDFPFGTNVKVISQDKDFVAIGTLRLTPISVVTGTVYFKDKNLISTCKSDSIARALQKKLLGTCDKEQTLHQLMDVNSAIVSAKRLNRLGLIEEAQDVLTYIDRTYGKSCNCGCTTTTTIP